VTKTDLFLFCMLCRSLFDTKIDEFPRKLVHFFRHVPENIPSWSDLCSPMIEEIEAIPNIHQQERRDFGAGIWGSEFGRLASRDWAASPRLADVRGVGSSRTSSAAKQTMIRSKSGDSLKNYAVPNGPAGPEGPSPRTDPGRPDWHRMFAGEHRREPISSGSENEGDSSSEVRRF
jgi:hypothetical protein